MVTTIAFHILLYCTSVLAGGLVLRLCARWWPAVRGLATRIITVFGIFAIAAGYVWLHLGPELDHRAALQNQPILLPTPPRSIEI